METASISLLVAGLLLFLVSTRQWAFWLRAAIWIAGAITLAAAAALIGSDNGHSGLIRAAIDLWQHWRSPGESVIAQALARNGPNVGRFVMPLVDVFLILAAAMGALALTAFTPGQAIERASRPLMIAVVGAIFGGALALLIVGTGFGAPLDQRTYANFVTREDVHDGDTFWIGETSVRLLNIDAPELEQVCRREGRIENCGALAQRHLGEMLDGALVLCEVSENGKGRTRESFGRPLVICTAQKEGRRFNVGARMLRDGFAVQHESGTPSPTALQREYGILGACSLTPRTWRNNREAREAFIADGTLPESPMDRLGRCSP